MPDHAPSPVDVPDRARRVRLACFDVDGTLTDGRLTFDSTGGELKSFHVHDGQGLVLLRRAGIQVALVTARASTIVERRAAELGIQACTAVADKLACVAGIARAQGIDLADVAFMGDDLPDLHVMLQVGLAACPRDAQPRIRSHAHWESRYAGGQGAAREFCDLLLEAQGRMQPLVDGLLHERPVELGAQA
jgi:3-deoxy-D-manno-octulosonate 8-phosphate phosphatase (KDO 8-P phosphatase)